MITLFQNWKYIHLRQRLKLVFKLHFLEWSIFMFLIYQMMWTKKSMFCEFNLFDISSRLSKTTTIAIILLFIIFLWKKSYWIRVGARPGGGSPSSPLEPSEGCVFGFLLATMLSRVRIFTETLIRKRFIKYFC